MHNILLFAAIAVAMAFAAPKFLAPKDAGVTLATAKPATPAAPQASPYYNSVTLRADAHGHFMTDAIVDGRRMDFLVDTGASVIALRQSDASRLGIHPSPRDFTIRAATANGTVLAAPVELNRVEVGGISVRQVRAMVLPDTALGQNLLGMSFLSRVRWQQANGRLVLEQ